MTSSSPWRPASTGPDCTRRSSRSASFTGPTVSVICSGGSRRAGGSTIWTRGPRTATSWPSGGRSCAATATTPASSPGPRSTRRWDIRDPRAHQRIHEDAYAVCKSLDPTRPVNDASGYVHHVTDLYTVHSYEQDPAKLSEQLADRPGRGVFRNHPDLDAAYEGQPYLIDEFGGIKWDPGTQDDASGEGQNPVSWGYGTAPASLEEFYRRLEALVRAVMAHDHICGWCYTQLTDVEQERNGIYRYDRSEKFDMERIRRIFSIEP